MVLCLRVDVGLVCGAGEVGPRRATLCPPYRLCGTETRHLWSLEALYRSDGFRLRKGFITSNICNENN
jgi:hypothetical protein